MYVLLGEEDRKRLGLGDDPLPVSLGSVRMREAIDLQVQTGWTIEKLEAAVRGKVVRDADGQPVYEIDDDGEYLKDEHNKRVPKRETDITALLPLVWFAVRRAGYDVRYDDFDFEVTAVEILDEPPGKS